MIFWLVALTGVGCVVLGRRMKSRAASDKAGWPYVTGALHRDNLLTPPTVTWQRPDGTPVTAPVQSLTNERLKAGEVGMWVHPSDPARFRLDLPDRNAVPRNIILIGVVLSVLGFAQIAYQALP